MLLSLNRSVTQFPFLTSFYSFANPDVALFLMLLAISFILINRHYHYCASIVHYRDFFQSDERVGNVWEMYQCT